jgi:hypothetical protein
MGHAKKERLFGVNYLALILPSNFDVPVSC